MKDKATLASTYVDIDRPLPSQVMYDKEFMHWVKDKHPELYKDYKSNDKPTVPELIREQQDLQNRDLANGRFYHKVGDDNQANWRPSVTTLLSVLHKGHGFNQWNRNLGHLAPQVRDAAACRGNHVHYWMKALIEGEVVDAEMIKNQIELDDDQGWKYSYKTVRQFSHSIRRYLSSFLAFWKEHKPTPVACEYPIYDEGLPFAGRFDMLLKMKKAKNSKKESLMIVDLKTGANYWSHGLQNSAYKYGWDKEYPDMTVDYIASLYVTDSYRNDPTYKLQYQNYDYDSFLRASELWYKENSNVKGELKPALKPSPQHKFSLYE